MSTGRWAPAAVGYQKYLIVACGVPYRSDVEVLDSSSGRWYSAQPVPVGGHRISSVVIDGCWYLSSYGRSAHSTTEHIWHELPTPPVVQTTLLALWGHLLLVGGEGYSQEIHRYDKEAREWRVCGQLPVGRLAPCCAILPSGDLMVAGGVIGDTKAPSKRMWLANI